MKAFMRLFTMLLSALAMTSQLAQAIGDQPAPKTPVNIGVLAYQDKAKTAQRWTPLFDYLNQQLPNYQFTPLYLHNQEFTQAALAGELSFLFTQPAHYVSLSYQMSLTSPLVMLVNKEGGMALDHFGGLMVVRADNNHVKHMGDMRGKIIATVDKSTLGSFQMQAFELLEAGIDPFKDIKLLELGQPQENAVEAMLTGRADVAFVRTGVIESMVKSGRLNHQDVRIIDAQWRADFPFLTSTRLYPEWPLVANAQTDTQLIRDVTASLLSLAHHQKLAEQLSISGFTIPGDYRMIDTLMLALKLPPFDQTPPFTLSDLWQHWHNYLIAMLIISLVALFMLTRIYRRLRQQMIIAQQEHQASRQDLAIEHLHLRTLLNTLPNLVWVKDEKGVYLVCNHRFEALYGVSEAEILGKTDYDFVDKETADFFRKHDMKAFKAGKALTNEERLTFADGHQELCETVKIPMFDEQNRFIGILGVAHDITERKATEAALQLKETMLNRAQSVAKIGSWHINADDKTLYWSDQTYRLFHIPIGTPVTYQDFIERVHPDDQNSVNTAWTAALKGAPYDIQHRILVNGQTKWVHEMAELVINSDGKLVSAIGTVQDISSKKADEARINQLAFYDPLTQLPNRSLLMEQLAQSIAIAKREHTTQILILINIDRFKLVNDAQGNAAGDALLVVFSDALKPLMRQGDLLSRIGADEFALMAINTDKSVEHASRHAQYLVESIQQHLMMPLNFMNESVTVTASFGITLFPREDSAQADQVLRQADTALHRAKHNGGNQIAFFEEAMSQSVTQSFRIERELRQALEAQQLRLYLQPQVDVNGNLVGAEVLVRWQHPERGLIPPGVFIPVAESSDLIVEIGAWVMTQACKLLANSPLNELPIRLSVNLSPRHFRKTHFVAWMKNVLLETGADATKLTLEITEGLVIDNVHDVIAKMSELSALGIHFSIDDFGTGYSSLAYIKRLPIQELKIDKSFVQDAPCDPNDAALIETILSIAQHMHLSVVAEGVETQAQADFLNQRAQVIHQGYLFGKPEPADYWITRWQQSLKHSANS